MGSNLADPVRAEHRRSHRTCQGGASSPIVIHTVAKQANPDPIGLAGCRLLCAPARYVLTRGVNVHAR
jgi:hypothetical protein